MADWIPGISQLKSLVQVICNDPDGARRTQENFSKQCPVVSQTRSAVEAISGDTDAARRTQMEYGHTVSGAVDSVPVVGHIKGGIHYAFGDGDGGDNAMKAASRTTGAIAGGTVGLMIGGPPGAIAGGIAGGAVMDGIITGVDTGVHGNFRPSGYVQQVSDIVDEPTDSGTFFDTGVMLVGDGTAKRAPPNTRKYYNLE